MKTKLLVVDENKTIHKNIIVITSYDAEETIRKVGEYGVQYFVLKPFDLKNLERNPLDIEKNIIPHVKYQIHRIGLINQQVVVPANHTGLVMGVNTILPGQLSIEVFRDMKRHVSIAHVMSQVGSKECRPLPVVPLKAGLQ